MKHLTAPAFLMVALMLIAPLTLAGQPENGLSIKLGEAVLNNDIGQISLLLKQGASPNLLDANGQNALELAIANQSVEAVQLLIEAGADLERLSLDGYTPIQQTILLPPEPGLAIMKMLLAAGANVETPNIYIDRTKAFMKMNVPSMVVPGQTALELAIANQSMEAVKLLIEAGADLEKISSGDLSPLKQAVLLPPETGLPIIKMLLAAGAKIDAFDDEKLMGTALSLAAIKGKTEALTMLLEAGADPNILNGTRKGPILALAAMGGHPEIVKILLAAGADPNAADEPYGYTVLHSAAEAFGAPDSTQTEIDNITETVRLLLAAGAKINVKNADGHTPLFYARQQYRPYVEKLLLEAGAE